MTESGVVRSYFTTTPDATALHTRLALRLEVRDQEPLGETGLCVR